MSPKTTDIRSQAILSWLIEQLKFDIHRFEPASQDASFRRYFRVIHSGGTHIVMDAPPDKENTEPFIRIAAVLKKAGIHVPTIYRKNLDQGFLLLEDLGSQSFLDQLNDSNVDLLYQSALDSLFKLQTRARDEGDRLPQYDRALLQRELDIFHQWFLGDLLAIELTEKVKTSFDNSLIDSALAQPRVCVHRDFHSRNLMFLGQRPPGVIDFQDAVVGPITYDLVSLLRDCYVDWPQQRVDRWMQHYFQRLTDAGMITVDIDRFRRWFDLMGLQRHLKAIGIFARLHLRDGKPGYLADIPRTMNYVTTVCRLYPELERFDHFLQRSVLPVYQDRL